MSALQFLRRKAKALALRAVAEVSGIARSAGPRLRSVQSLRTIPTQLGEG